MDILSLLLIFMPLIFLLWLANLAQARGAQGDDATQRLLTAVVFSLLIALYGMLILFGLAVQALGAVATGPMAETLGDAYLTMGLDPAAFGQLGLGMWLPAVLGIILLLPPVRRSAARLIPLSSASPVHAVALSYSALILANLLMTLGLGLDNLAQMLQAAGPLDMTPALWVQELLLALMSLVGVGWLTRRSLGQVLERLAIVRPTLPQVTGAVGLGLLLPVAIIGLETLLSHLGIAGDADVEKLTEQLLGPLTRSVLGIVTLGVAAAIGEETLFRGALQPRFGLLVTTVLFALLHSTYGLTVATALVFLVGLVVGAVRQRANTTSSMIVHALYNMTLGVISYLGVLDKL